MICFHAVKVKSMFLQSEAEALLPLHPRHNYSTDPWVWQATRDAVVSQHHGRCVGVAWTHVETSHCRRKKGFWPITSMTNVPWLQQHSHIDKASLVRQHPDTSQSIPCHHLYCCIVLITAFLCQTNQSLPIKFLSLARQTGCPRKSTALPVSLQRSCRGLLWRHTRYFHPSSPGFVCPFVWKWNISATGSTRQPKHLGA